MSYLTVSDLALIRSRPQSSRLYLSIYQPATVFKARVMNVSGTWGDTTIIYTGTSYGFWSGITPNQTMLVGSTDGGREHGRIRVKGATGTSIKVAENDDVNFVNGAYLTVIDYHELFPVYAMIGNQLDSSGDIIIYPDGDTKYVNQGLNLGSLINMGSHYAGFSENPVFYSASGTVHVKGEAISSYLWKFGGGNPATSTSQTPGNVSYATPGHYTTELIVTSASGTVDRSYRQVSIYNHSTVKPIESWGITNLQGSREEGGYTASLWIRENVNYLVDGALVVIFSDDSYGSTDGSIGGNGIGRNKILFAGYVLDNTIVYDSQSSRTDFEVASITGLMKKKNGFSVSIDSKRAPAKWQEGYDLNLKRSIYYFYRWYSTLLQVADLKYIGQDLPIQYLETDMDNLYDGMNSFIENTVVGRMVSDRQGTIFIEPGIEITDGATGVYPVTMSLLKQDWIDQPTVTVKTLNTVSSLEMGGFAYSGAVTGTSKQYLSQAPGYAPSYSGQPEQGEAGLVLIDQNDSNVKTGNKFAYLNAKYPEINFKLAGAYRNIDIAPYEQLKVNIMPPDTNYGITMIDEPYHPIEISYTYDAEWGVLQTSLTVHQITQGYPAKTVDIPVPIIDNWQPQPLIPWNDFSLFPFELNPPAMISAPDIDLCSGIVFVGEHDNQYQIAGLIGTYESTGMKTRQATPFYCYIRPHSVGITQTTYEIDGDWLSRLTSGTLSSWADTLTDNWYHVYLLRDGVRIFEGTHNAVDSLNPEVRTGYFDLPSGIFINGLELALDEELFDVNSISIYHTAGDAADSESVSYFMVNPTTIQMHYVGQWTTFYPPTTILFPNKGSGTFYQMFFERKLINGLATWAVPHPSFYWTDIELGDADAGSIHFENKSFDLLPNINTQYNFPSQSWESIAFHVPNWDMQGVYIDFTTHADVLAGKKTSTYDYTWQMKLMASKKLVVSNFLLYNVCGATPQYQNQSADITKRTNGYERGKVLGDAKKTTFINTRGGTKQHRGLIP